MKYLFNYWSAFVLMVFLIYVGYAFPLLNVAKAAELWGAQNKWTWYAIFCLKHTTSSLRRFTMRGGI
jgi:hypothetical protein